MTTIRSLQKPRTVAALLFGLIVSACLCVAADPPQARISNGQITAKIYLPDATNGFYRSTRFDWSGAVYSLQYKGHDFYRAWFDKIDPSVINWVHQDGQIVSGLCSGLWGPVEEFETPLGWNDAQPGGTFIKIGVGVLRRGDGNYNRYRPYEVLDPGKRSVKTAKDAIEFTEELNDPATGYGYLYKKIVRLAPGKPEMTIEHSLKNTGKRAIVSTVYNHNFVVIDKQGPGPDYTFKVPYEIKETRPANNGLTEVHGNQVVFLKPYSGQDEAAVFLQGFSADPKDTEIVIENKKAGAGVKISGDHPLTRAFVWSIRTVLAVEPYIAINIEPGAEFTWKNQFDYYTLSAVK
jgi:hypothetical protein